MSVSAYEYESMCTHGIKCIKYHLMSKIVNRQKFEMKSKTIKMTKTKQPFPFIQIFLTRVSSVCSYVCFLVQDYVCQLMTKEGTTMLVAAVAAERASYLSNRVNPKCDQLLVF